MSQLKHREEGREGVGELERVREQHRQTSTYTQSIYLAVLLKLSTH
jgi:hypothetical protein